MTGGTHYSEKALGALRLPVVERLEDAPEVGPALLHVPSSAWLPAGFPVVNREIPFFVKSCGGWNTEALNEQLFDLIHAETVCKNPDSIQTDAAREYYNCDGVFVWAPTAEAAIERYYAREACPFGEVRLKIRRFDVPSGYAELEFESHAEGTLIAFGSNGEVTLGDPSDDDVRGGHYLHGCIETGAYCALLSEVTTYIAAERARTRDSRIHKALEAAK